jgi:hypothetical protein
MGSQPGDSGCRFRRKETLLDGSGEAVGVGSRDAGHATAAYITLWNGNSIYKPLGTA